MPAEFPRRRFLQLAAGAAAAAGLRAGRRPNVVFILADDLGWRDTSCYGSTFCETPNIDALAARGMRFTQAYAANPLCSPTRASILTGLWPARIGITAPACHLPDEVFSASVAAAAPADQPVLQCASATRLKLEYRTLAEALRDAGYRTAHFGKWHLGHEPYDPLHQGFDVDVPHTPGAGPGGGYFAPYRFAPGLAAPAGTHIEERLADEAIAFVRENRHRPFYLSYWTFSVHSPWVVDGVLQGKPELMGKYRRKADPANPQRNPLYGAMVEMLDTGVGKLLGALDELGLRDDTIVVFFSDNGGVHFHEEPAGVPITSNAPLRGGKATIYEGGTREACIVSWPGRVAAGAVNDTIVQSIDFYPTLLDLMGLAPEPGQQFDGRSFAPVLRGTGELEREAIFCFFPHLTPATGAVPSVYVRRREWKLIRRFCAGPGQAHAYELYNLAEDIGETRDVAGERPALVRELDALIDGFLAESGAVVPRPNPAYDPAAPAGWTPGPQARLRRGEGTLLVESIGNDPSFSSRPPFEAAGALTLEARLRSEAAGRADVYWQRRGDRPAFAPARRLELPVRHDGQWHEVRVALAVPGIVVAIRIDPASGPGRIEFDWIRLRDAAGAVVQEWDFDP